MITTTQGYVVNTLVTTVPAVVVTSTSTFVELLKRAPAVTALAQLPPAQESLAVSIQSCGTASLISAVSSACSCLNIPPGTTTVGATAYVVGFRSIQATRGYQFSNYFPYRQLPKLPLPTTRLLLQAR